MTTAPEPPEQPSIKPLFRAQALARLQAPRQADNPPTRAATPWPWLLAGGILWVIAASLLLSQLLPG